MILPVVVFCVGISGCASSRLERNKQVVRDNAKAYNEHDVSGLRNTLSPDLKRRCQATPDVEVHSAEDFISFAEREWTTFPDGQLVIERLVAEDDRVGVWGRFTGTQEGSMGPFPPSNRRMELDFGGVFRIESGRIAEILITWDNLAALTQLGHWAADSAMPTPYDALLSPVVFLPVTEGDHEVAYLPSTTYLPCRIRLPADLSADTERDLVVALHGFGSSADRFAGLSEDFTREGMIFAAPQAPWAFPSESGIGYDWDRAHHPEADPEVDKTFGKMSVGYIVDVIAALRAQYRVRDVYLFGFSQGGAYASIVGIHFPEMVSGVISVGMGIDPEWCQGGTLERGFGVPVLFVHSPEDSRVPITFAQETIDLLKEHGYDVSMAEYPGGHRVTEDALAASIQWLRDRQAQRTQAGSTR